MDCCPTCLEEDLAGATQRAVIHSLRAGPMLRWLAQCTAVMWYNLTCTPFSSQTAQWHPYPLRLKHPELSSPSTTISNSSPERHSFIHSHSSLPPTNISQVPPIDDKLTNSLFLFSSNMPAHFKQKGSLRLIPRGAISELLDLDEGGFVWERPEFLTGR